MLQKDLANKGIVKNNTSFFSARVKKVILDDKQHPDLFKQLGEWNSIGAIVFEDIQKPLPDIEDDNFAYPLFPDNKYYPLVNEAVFIFKLASFDLQGNPSLVNNYYITPINIWNNINHNAIPDNIYGEQSNQQKSYGETERGNVRKTTPNDIYLGETFIERDIKALLPFEGDKIIEGRWGNSIRLTSTNDKTPWEGVTGDPLIIIGNHNEKTLTFDSIVEDINKDVSSVYVSSTQKLPLNVSSKRYNSYTSPPIDVKQFNKSQIILNADRLVLNSKTDHILLTSKKTVNLNAIESINLDSKKIIISGDKVHLGDKNAIEPLMYGNKTVKLLQQIFTALNELALVLPTVGTPSPGVPNIAVANSAAKLNATLSQLIPTLPTLTSKQTYTI
jgi:hypothetical protein